MLLVASASLAEAVDADHRSNRGVFVDGVGGAIGVGDRADVELIDIVDGDRERPGR